MREKMKLKKNTTAFIALVTAMVIAINQPVKVEDNGFTLEDSIRHQIFQ